MIAKEKMFIVSGNVDDSIKSVTPIYDISIFPNFLTFTDYIETTPVALSSIIISERDLPFNNTSMLKLSEIIKAPFLNLNGNITYLISLDTKKSMVLNFIESMGLSDKITVLQGDLTSRYISDVVSGAARISDEEEIEVVTYRMRASEYAMSQNVKRYESDEDEYITDEKDLADIPDIPEPVVSIPSTDAVSSIHYVVGKQSKERALFSFLQAQYLSLTGKVVIVESDVEYHRLTDLFLRSDIQHDFINMEDLYANPKTIINNIKMSNSRIVFIGCVNRFRYDYDFIFDIILNNTIGSVNYFVKECSFNETPYGFNYNIVCADNVPDVLECLSSIKYDVQEDKVKFIGVRTAYKNETNISGKELQEIVRVVLDKNNLYGEVFEINGTTLRGDGQVYDMFNIMSKGNERRG